MAVTTLEAVETAGDGRGREQSGGLFGAGWAVREMLYRFHGKMRSAVAVVCGNQVQQQILIRRFAEARKRGSSNDVNE